MAAINKSDNVMKANEIPEKIYVTEGMLFMTNPEITLRGNGNKIEYTRTDNFIENAWNWIEDNILSSNQQDKSRLYFEQFKKYIKGE